MGLKVDLKPNEQIIIGSCVITNSETRASFLIEGERIPVLREKDIMTPATADTPAKLIYLAVQLMYLSSDPIGNHATYFNLVREVVANVPSAWPMIEEINNNILNGDLYKALKEAKKLIVYEAGLISQARATKQQANQTA
jgi:flagellar protein FlbT